jgi:hypothetical protein
VYCSELVSCVLINFGRAFVLYLFQFLVDFIVRLGSHVLVSRYSRYWSAVVRDSSAQGVECCGWYHFAQYY